MAEIKSLRIQIYEALRDGLIDLVLADPSWAVAERNVVSEPSEVPQAPDTISIRIVTYNAKVDLKPFIFAGQGENPTTYTMNTVQSTIRVQAMGVKAFVWLDVFLQALEDDEVIRFFRERGFSVESDDAGIADVSSIIGAREQTRGVATLNVGCRAIRERVTPHESTISADTQLAALDPDTPVTVIQINESLE